MDGCREDAHPRMVVGEKRGTVTATRVSLPARTSHRGFKTPSPVLDRLSRKQHIVPIYERRPANVPTDELGTDKDPVDPDYFAITYDGRLRATQPAWWEFWR
jgi:hypothetical protein